MICPDCGNNIPDYCICCPSCGRSFVPPQRPAPVAVDGAAPAAVVAATTAAEAPGDAVPAPATAVAATAATEAPADTAPVTAAAAADTAAAEASNEHKHADQTQAASAQAASLRTTAQSSAAADKPAIPRRPRISRAEAAADDAPAGRSKWPRRLLAAALVCAVLALVWGLGLSPSARYDHALHRADAALAAADYESALTCYSRAVRIRPTAEALRGQAAAYLNLGQPEQAAACYRYLLELEPQSASAYAALTEVYMAVGDYRQALSTLNEGIAVTASASLRQQLDALLEQLGITDYTAEEIAAADNIWPLGAPAAGTGNSIPAPDGDVVAVFDPDSGTMKITRNGLDSDGVMADLAAYDGDGAVESGSLQPWLALPPAERPHITRLEIGSGVVNLGAGAFWGCTDLTAVQLGPDVTEIGPGALAGCEKLTQVDMAAASRLTRIGDAAFRDCAALTGLALPDSVEALGSGCFSGSGLTSLTLPASLTLLTQGALNDCPALTEVTVNTAMADLGTVPFYQCPRLETINVSADNINYSSYDGLLYDKAGSTLLRCPEGRQSCDFSPALTAVADRACYNCGQLAAAELPEGLTVIGREAFAFCPRLVSVRLPASLTGIGSRAFVYCASLSGFTVSGGGNFQLSGDLLLSGDGAELICCPAASAAGSSRGVLRLPRSVRTVAEGACVGCGFTGLICTGVTSIGAAAFADCSNLSSAVLPESVTAIGPGAFGSASPVIYCKSGSYAEEYAKNAGYQVQPVTDFLFSIFN
ncbi:MAG: leucine-rich repeat protein [Firmicutes bacterium]|nr:leucine-rich repeat protein [Bacillota bacterium]